jgi:hypothetical protein
MTQENVRSAIIRAFASVPKPDPAATLECQCAHCLPLRDDFVPYGWRDVPAEVVDRQSTHLSLFTPSAFEYYLPAYLLRSIDDPHGDVCIFTAHASMIWSRSGDGTDTRIFRSSSAEASLWPYGTFSPWLRMMRSPRCF